MREESLSVNGSLPDVPEVSWRDAKSEDQEELESLQRASQQPAGPVDRYALTDLSDLFDPELVPHAVVGEDRNGALRAYAFVFQHTVPQAHRIYLDARTDPSCPVDVEESLLRWYERESARRLDSLTGGRPVVARIDFSDRREGSIKIYEQYGYRLALAEDTMVRSLDDPILQVHVDDLAFVPWSETTVPWFYQVYVQAFRERPGFPGWNQEEWTEALTGGTGFRKDLSALAVVRSQPVGFVISSVRESITGWIDQIGVAPQARGRGVAAALIAHTLDAFRPAGLRDAGLEVNANNEAARRVDEHAGFQERGRRRVYEKTLRG